MKRRHFLTFIAALIGPLHFVTWLSPAAAETAGTRHPALLELCGRKTFLEIGKEYLRLVPSENDAQTLGQLIDRTGAVKSDFASGAVVTILGWVISRTEARTAALSFLHTTTGQTS